MKRTALIGNVIATLISFAIITFVVFTDAKLGSTFLKALADSAIMGSIPVLILFVTKHLRD